MELSDSLDIWKNMVNLFFSNLGKVIFLHV